MGKGKKALFHAAVKPLQQPALGSEEQKGEQSLHEQRVAVIEELPPIGARLLRREPKVQGNARLPPVGARNQPVAKGSCPQHEVLLGKERVNIQPVGPEHEPQQAHSKQRHNGAHHLGRNSCAHGIVHGAQHAAPPCQKSPQGCQRCEPQGHIGHEQFASRRNLQQTCGQQNNSEYRHCNAHVKADEAGLCLPPRKGIVKAGGGSHIQKAGKLLEQVGGKAVIAVHLRPESAGQNGLHDKVDRDGGDIGHELEYVAAGQSWGRALHAGKLAHFGGALKWLRPVRKKYLFSRGDSHTSGCVGALGRGGYGVFTGVKNYRTIHIPIAGARGMFVVHTIRIPSWMMKHAAKK